MQKSASQRTGEFSNTADSQDESGDVSSGWNKNKKDGTPALSISTNPGKLSPRERADSTAKGETTATTPAAASRPNSPMTGVSRASDSSSVRQPRVLRVVEMPKNETPPPPSATQSVSSSIQVKKHSRRPSLSSLVSRPDTPADFGSEGGDPPSFTSASVSRANSPPPAPSVPTSRIGSAPVRTVSKSQAKKERRQKAKDAEARNVEAAAPVEEAIQAPIVGRKRKTKKPGPSSTSGNTKESQAAPDVASSRTMVDNEKPETSKKVKASSEVESPAAVEEKHVPRVPANNTVEQMIKDSKASGIPIKDLFAERTSSLQSLLAELHKSGDIDLNEHPLFNPSNLGQRVDMKCSAGDYEMLKQPIELTDDDRKALLRGEAVRILEDPLNLQKDRCLISPHGCILRHLSPEEEERYLVLEKRLGSGQSVDPFPDYPVAPVTEPDGINRAGGLDALFATPESFNVLWVDESSASTSPQVPFAPSGDSASELTLSSMPRNILSAMEADRSHHLGIANTAELVNATASVRSFAAAAAKHMLGSSGTSVSTHSSPDLGDVIGMTGDELRSFALKSQKELEGSRKELDAIDKKLSGLVKKNKKLVQQALASEAY